MARVTAQMSISLDGYYAGPRFDGPPDDPASWMQSPEALGFFRITSWVLDAMAWRQRLGFEGGERNVGSEILEETFERAGAYVMGRRMADGGEIPWGDEPPFHAPVFVVTHRQRATLQRQGGTSFTYVTDGLASAVAQAKAACPDGKDVAIAGGGSLLRQAIGAGLLDEVELHVVPVLLGDGMRLFEPAGLAVDELEAIELVPTRVVETEQATHIRYDVVGRSQLGVDERVLTPEA